MKFYYNFMKHKKRGKMQYKLYFDYENKKAQKTAFENVLKEYESQEVGYYHLPEISQKFKNLEFEGFDEIVIIGIGGSSLGTKAIYEMIKNKFKVKKMIFLENPDPIDLISKSLLELRVVRRCVLRVKVMLKVVMLVIYF